MGEFDQPAQIDYVLKTTGFEKLAAYVGHSQGTSQMFTALAEHYDDIDKKIGHFFACAPITRLTHEKNWFMDIISY